MEETNKSRNDHGENKKMVIKIGGGGGIGAVVLLGGALATAALASVFAVRHKRRSSGEDSQNSSPEINNKSEKDEADISEGAKEEVELKYDSIIKIYAQSLKLDDKAMVETDEPISDDGFVIKKEIPFLAENQMPEDEKTKVDFTKEDVSDDYSHDQTVADKNADMEKRELESFCNGNGETNEEKCVELKATEKDKVDLSEAIIVSVRLSKGGEKTLLPLFEGHDIQQDNVDGDDEEGSLPTDDVEMVRVDEAIVGSQEDKVEYIEEKTVEEDEKCYVSDAGIVPKQNHLVDDLAGELGEVDESLEVCESKTSMQFDAKKNVEKEMEVELISLEYVEVARDGANGEAPQKVEPDGNGTSVQYPVSHPDDSKDDVERENEKEELIKKKSLVQFVSDGDRVKDLNDEAALSNDSCSESNWEALWQAELPQQVKLMKYEVGGKIQEDTAVKQGMNSEKSSANFPVVADKYAVELGRVKDYPTNSMRWRMIIWTVSVLSSLSCSWFVDLSFAKLCLVVFLTAFLLEIYGYSLLNRQHAQCSLAAEEDLAYDHTKPSNKLANI